MDPHADIARLILKPLARWDRMAGMTDSAPQGVLRGRDRVCQRGRRGAPRRATTTRSDTVNKGHVILIAGCAGEAARLSGYEPMGGGGSTRATASPSAEPAGRFGRSKS